MSEQTDYVLSEGQAELIAGLAIMPHDMRLELLLSRSGQLGTVGLCELLSHVVGMANSVALNCRQWVETEAIVHLDMHPHAVEQINIPSMLGAALGAKIAAQTPQAGLCEGCAARLGTMANQCLPTVTDIDWCEGKGEFLCHLDGLDARGSPKQPCVGHTRLQAHKRAAREVQE